VKLAKLTKEKLLVLYKKERKSLEDIGRLYGVSRSAIFKKLKKFNIKQRSKDQTRLEAQRQGKLPQQYFSINENFFSEWSAEMAYVLGLFITDGCVSNTHMISLSMNEKGLLEKVKRVMGSQHKITLSKHQKSLYCFRFGRKKMVKDLRKFGIKPKKSLSVEFPKVPNVFLGNFIRGVFDGDGSVFFDPRSKEFPIRSKFGGGSRNFIEKLETSLQSLGLPKRNIYEQKTKNGVYYMFIYGHKDSKKLFTILYENIQNELFLERKYKKFLKGFQEENSHGKRDGRVA